MNSIDQYYSIGEQRENTDMDPYTTFVFGIRSPYTKESYCRRLRGFFDAINLGKGNTLGERCNFFVHKGRADPNWAFNNILRFLHYQKERVGKKEITAGTLHNYVKTLKMFCEITDIAIPWKKITRGLPSVTRIEGKWFQHIIFWIVQVVKSDYFSLYSVPIGRFYCSVTSNI